MELSQLVAELSNNVIYIGDINISLLDENTVTQSYNNILNSNGFVSLINKATRITANSQTNIDHIFIRNRFRNTFYSDVFDLGITLQRNTSYPCHKQFLLYNSYHSR